MPTRTVDLKYLARVEGEAGFHVKISGHRVDRVELRIFEPPRFFEALLRGRDMSEAPDITSRICGICPIAYQLTSALAIERALGVSLPGELQRLRKILYFGEWISSHALHVHLLHAPDFLGFPDIVSMAKDHRDAVERGLELKKIGNQLMSLINGREVHGVNVRVGGFYRSPSRAEVTSMVEQLKRAVDLAVESTLWVSKFDFPHAEYEHELVALCDDAEYPILTGRVVSTSGLNISAEDFVNHFVESQVHYSTALHAATVDRKLYLTGPMARFFHNSELLSPLADQLVTKIGLRGNCRNPYKSIVIRSVEVLHACEEALNLAMNYSEPSVSCMPIDSPKEPTMGFACTEAPRGLLYHAYHLDIDGKISSASIIPPTSQNQSAMEMQLHRLVEAHVEDDESKLRELCEKSIRNFDPCISCAAHFLDFSLERNA